MRERLFLLSAAALILHSGCALWGELAPFAGPEDARSAVRRSWDRVDDASKHCPSFDLPLFARYQASRRLQDAAEKALSEGRIREAYRLALRAERRAQDAKERAISQRQRLYAEYQATAKEALRQAERAVATSTVFPGVAVERVLRAHQWVKMATFELSYGDFAEGKLFSDFAKKEAIEARSPQPTRTASATPTPTRTASVTATVTASARRRRS